MKCASCKYGETKAGTTTTFIKRAQTIMVYKNIPAQICKNCGEPHFDDETTDWILEIMEEGIRSGVEVSVNHYVDT